MNVEEQKQEARAIEQQGETEKALALYEQILSELEGTQEIWRELPLYVKAGDLSLRLGNSSSAISHYDKAARAYAAYGSSKSVIALCSKIIRENPEHTHVYLRLVRLMIERDHFEESRLVLVEYAERMKLNKAGAVLGTLSGCPEGQCKPVLEMLLELGGRYEYARAQGRDLSIVTDTDRLESDGEESKDTVDHPSAVQSVGEESIGPAEQERFEFADAQRDSGEGADVSSEKLDPPIEQGPPAESVSQATPDLVPQPAEPEPDESDFQWIDDRPLLGMAPPRSSRQVLFREIAKKDRPKKALWILFGLVGVILVGGLGLVLFGVIPLGGSDQTASPFGSPLSSTDSVLTAGVDLDDSTGAAADSTDASSANTVVGGATDTTTPASDNQPAETPATSLPPAATEDSSQVETEDGTDTTQDAEVETDLPSGRGVMVQDFEIESVTEFTDDGRPGFRITQFLGTGELLTLSAVYYGDNIASAPGSESMALAPLVGDTTAAIIQFGGYVVEARAVVSASALETLLNRLAEVPESD